MADLSRSVGNQIIDMDRLAMVMREKDHYGNEQVQYSIQEKDHYGNEQVQYSMQKRITME